jgi:hypothetical protein
MWAVTSKDPVALPLLGCRKRGRQHNVGRVEAFDVGTWEREI